MPDQYNVLRFQNSGLPVHVFRSGELPEGNPDALQQALDAMITAYEAFFDVNGTRRIGIQAVKQAVPADQVRQVRANHLVELNPSLLK